MSSYQTEPWARDTYPQSRPAGAGFSPYPTGATQNGASPYYDQRSKDLYNKQAKVPDGEVTRTATANSKWYDSGKNEEVSSGSPNSYNKTSNARKQYIANDNENQTKSKSKCRKILFILLGLLLVAGVIVGIVFAIKHKNKARQNNIESTACPNAYFRYQGQCIVCPSDSTWSVDKCTKQSGEKVNWIVFNNKDQKTNIIWNEGSESCETGFFFYNGQCITCPTHSTWNGSHCLKQNGIKKTVRVEKLVQDFLSSVSKSAIDHIPVNSTTNATTASTNTTQNTNTSVQSNSTDELKAPSESHKAATQNHQLRVNFI